jgi:hypothetical protein
MTQGLEQMNGIQLFVAVGVAVGLLVIFRVVGLERFRKRADVTQTGPAIPKTLMGGLGIGSLAGITALLARRGQDNPVQTSDNTVVMTPTPGLRLISLGGSAIALALTWSPLMQGMYDGISLHIAITALLVYAVLFVAGYEARYDENGITAPNWLFKNKHYAWEEFIFIKDDGRYIFHLRFECGRLALQKYLVGMPTFLTFVSEVKEMINRR